MGRIIYVKLFLLVIRFIEFMELLKKYLSSVRYFSDWRPGLWGIGTVHSGKCLCLHLAESSVDAFVAPTDISVGDLPTITPVVTTPGLDLSTPTLSPTLVPTLSGTVAPTPMPSFIPSFGDGSAPSGKIVFACYINQIDQICIMNADGTGRKQLTNFKATAFYPSLSPDGQTVYFASNQSGNFEIYSIDINGNGLQRLTNKIGSLYAPELSPDGERIIFTNNGNGLWVMNPDGSNPHAITFHDDIDPTWSPDGSISPSLRIVRDRDSCLSRTRMGKKSTR